MLCQLSIINSILNLLISERGPSLVQNDSTLRPPCLQRFRFSTSPVLIDDTIQAPVSLSSTQSFCIGRTYHDLTTDATMRRYDPVYVCDIT